MLSLKIIDIYWRAVFRVLHYQAFRQLDTRNIPYQLALWLIKQDMNHIGGSWDCTQHVFDINPVDDSEDLF